MFKNEKGQISTPVLLISLGVAFVYFTAKEVKTGVHKLGCKIHVTHNNCEQKKP